MDRNIVGTMENVAMPSATPTLKVMRIQSPELCETAIQKPTSPALSSDLILPDSFGIINVGETFTAYVGALNADSSMPVTNLSIMAVLQTPTKRFHIPSLLERKYPFTNQDWNTYQPVNVEPKNGVDAIISRPIEEAGQHILRIEVSYGGYNGPVDPSLEESGIPNPRKTLRKFYRFHVSSPLHIRELTLRGGEATCFVSLAVENTSSKENGSSGALTISHVDFQPYSGLIAHRIEPTQTKSNSDKTALELFDECGRLNAGESRRYLFAVKAASEDATMRGIASGDEIGKAMVTWRKSMGEAGRIASTYVYCPPSVFDGGKEGDDENDGKRSEDFVVYGSGLSVDVAAAAAERSDLLSPGSMGGKNQINNNTKSLDEIFPVTVEPISPPSEIEIGQPFYIQVLVVNHSSKVMNLQLQFRLSQMKGIVVFGQSFQNLGEVQPNGSSVVRKVRLVAMLPGLFFVKGCFVVDLNSGMEIQQPKLFSTFVRNTEPTAESC
jgi:hypothetical protein